MENSRHLAEQLKDVVKCPVCFNSLDTSHSLCKSGHGVCSECKSKLNKCPSCQEEFVLHKATILNQILEILLKTCPFADNGCTRIGSTSEHRMFCEFRPTQCKIWYCPWKGSVKNLLDHVRVIHSDKLDKLDLVPGIGYRREYTIPEKGSNSQVTPLICSNKVFWKCFKWDAICKHIRHILFYFPTSKPTRDYYLIISFKKGEIEVKIPCKARAIRKDEDLKFVYNDSYFVFSDFLLEKYIEKRKLHNLPFTFTIIEEEISQDEVQKYDFS